MSFLRRLLLSTLAGLVLAVAFNGFFLGLTDRPLIDQVLSILVSTGAFGYMAYIWYEERTKVLQVLRSLRTRELHWPEFRRPAIVLEHLPGLLLALLFLIFYFYLGLRFNHPVFDTVDNYFDADNSSWMRRLSAPQGYQMEMRGPHPFAYFIFRPLGWVFNVFTGEPALSAILLNALAGALCIFLAWIFVKNQFHNRIYAFLMAGLLGLSTAHLLLGSLVETYIFSAATLIGFFLLLQTRPHALILLVTTSLLTFGITLTNFVQNFLALLVSRPRSQVLARFVSLVLSLGVILSLLHSAWFPSSRLFFLPSDAQAEAEFSLSIFRDPAWRAVGRVRLLIRTIFLYSMVAPRPYVLTEEVGGTFPRFNFFRISPEDFRLSSYTGLGNVLIFVWVGLLGVAGVMFLGRLLRDREMDFSMAFALCLLFNFLLHLGYGYEPFLYSPDWTYALLFFAAFGLAPFAKYRWFQAGLFLFLLLLAFHQWQFIEFILSRVSPFIPQGLES